VCVWWCCGSALCGTAAIAADTADADVEFQFGVCMGCTCRHTSPVPAVAADAAMTRVCCSSAAVCLFAVFCVSRHQHALGEFRSLLLWRWRASWCAYLRVVLCCHARCCPCAARWSVLCCHARCCPCAARWPVLMPDVQLSACCPLACTVLPCALLSVCSALACGLFLCCTALSVAVCAAVCVLHTGLWSVSVLCSAVCVCAHNHHSPLHMPLLVSLPRGVALSAVVVGLR